MENIKQKFYQGHFLQRDHQGRGGVDYLNT